MSTTTVPALPPNAALVGRGFGSDVFAWGPGRVLKLLHADLPRAKAEDELRVTRSVHAAGFPAPAGFEVIEVGGRWGIVFERIDGPTLFNYVQRRPWLLPWSVRLLAEMHGAIHRLPAPSELPTLHQWITGRIAVAELLAAERDAALAQLAKLPGGPAVCHGDFHPDNIVLSPAGPVVIDWGRAARGHPLGDVAATVRLLRTANLPDWAPRFARWLLRGTRTFIERRYRATYVRMNGGTRREIEAWLGPLDAVGAALTRERAGPASGGASRPPRPSRRTGHPS